MHYIEIRLFIVVGKRIEGRRDEIVWCLDLKPENILLKQQGRSGIKGEKE